MNTPVSLETKFCIHLHQTCPWIQHFLRVLVRPKTKIVSCDLLQQDIYMGGEVVYLPSWQFWYIHSCQCHNGGAGCSLENHYLLLENYDLYVQRTDLSYYRVTREDFVQECLWWRSNFPKLLKYVQSTGGLVDFNPQWPK
jgi:hypothetical protein